jgi:hypothetical protein
MRMADGCILFTFGIRTGKRGVGVRYSHDEGVSWSAPRVLLTCEGARDGGYPSSVSLYCITTGWLHDPTQLFLDD